MTGQRGSSNPHNMRRRPRDGLFLISKSTPFYLTTPNSFTPNSFIPNSFTPVDRHHTETSPLDDLFLDWLDRPRSVRGETATPPFGGLERESAMKTTEPEFEELPIAVQRKYFSTLERLRIARGTETARDLAQTKSSRSAAQRQQAPKLGTESHYTAPSTNSRRLRRTSKARSQSISLDDISWFQTLPDKIQRKQFSKQEQQQYRRHNLRKSVVLDAADEALFKPSRRNRTHTAPINQQPLERAPLAETGSNMQICKRERPTSSALAMAEQFLWMDEKNDLDQKLQLDDYHANLPDVVIPSSESSIRPSFRRNMSISKIPFSRPVAPTPIRTSSGPTSLSGSGTPISRGHSRAMSLMAPRFAPEAEFLRHSIDPHAAHYQNPDARLKLRVYLASPQKFDEVIEFGFPYERSVTAASSDKECQVSNKRGGSKSWLSDTNKTFFNDDAGSLLEDDTSIAEPDSPVTPSEDIFKHQHSRLMSMPAANTITRNEFAHLCSHRLTPHKHAESYSLSSTGAREMTLRMTLTRPDLRADEDVIYGWQAKERVKTPPKSDTPEPLEQAPMRGPFDGEDGWGPLPKNDGVVKRFWKKMKPQRKAACV